MPIASIASYLTNQSQTSQTSSSKATSGVQATASQTDSTALKSDSTSPTISTLARQLAGSANRVDALGKTMTRSQLAAKANAILSALTAKADATQQARHDREVPQTTDPELLARAKQATAFMADVRNGGTTTATNPFADLSREQLYDIVYDENGPYTFNERAAAFNEVSRQEAQWRDKVSADGKAEYNQTGKLTNFLTALRDHYKSLPAIQQSQYPEGYARNLDAKIAQNLNYRTSGNGKSFEALVNDILGNGSDTSAKPAAATARQSTATTRLTALRAMQQARYSDNSDDSTTSILQSHGLTTGASSKNTLSSGSQSSGRKTLFNFIDS